MKKKITLFAVLMVLLLSLVACGNDLNQQKEIYGVEKTAIASDMENMANVLISMDQETIAQNEEKFKTTVETSEGSQKEQAEIIYSLLQNWSTAAGQVGEFEGYGQMDIVKAGKTVTVTLPLYFSNRNANLVYVYKIIGSHMTESAINVSLVYSMGETMSRAGLNVVMGMGTVFLVLILISLVIWLFKFIPDIQKALSGEKKQQKAASTVQDSAATVVEEVTDDTELIAVIAAAIAASTGASTDDFVVRSIKRRY